jgi:hypothetical protein
MNVPLKVVAQPAPKTRCVLTLKPGSLGPLLKGATDDAPTYCCGNCGACLIEGVRASQFVNADEPFHSNYDVYHPVYMKVKETLISKTAIVPTEIVTTFTKNGPLLLTCPQCLHLNEMLAPNAIGPSQ